MQIRKKRPNDGYTKRRRKKIDRKNTTFQYRSARLRNNLRWKHQKDNLGVKNRVNGSKKEDEEHEKAIRKALILIELILSVQESLSGDDHDVQKAVHNLEELLHHQFSFLSLVYAPFIVKTVFQCRKYPGSEEVKRAARKCYDKFRRLFGVPYGEKFEDVFQNGVRDFWKNQNRTFEWEHFPVNGINGKTKYQKEGEEKDVGRNGEEREVSDGTRSESIKPGKVANGTA
ncbi:lens epithelium-derived growth factor-like [Centruroides vittatus]|uniref:lens epithelium-derived growth factor-like n=1 Tax=Centruroides vittatus TaxID=120091 RepID=UPI0035109532